MQDVIFQGLTGSLRLQGAASVLPVMARVALGWPFRVVPGSEAVAPFYTIRAGAEDVRLTYDCHLDDRPRWMFDAVDAVCDVVSALALALPADRPDLICLHAAAVAMSGRLVVFPNIRRAGKSTLSAALARAGYPLFSDDVLPVFQTTERETFGIAMGTAARLRLPLPDTVTAGFRNWVAAHAGPGNSRYQYLNLTDQPSHGTSLPIGAFVILDRRDGLVDAHLTAVTPDLAMDALLHQNFTRDRHSADILETIAETLRARPAYRLTYSDLDGAVACLQATFSEWSGSSQAPCPASGRSFRKAVLSQPAARLAPDAGPVRQRAGTTAVMLGGRLYLADPDGCSIHGTDPLAEAIWTLMEDPVSAEDIVDLLAAVFADADRSRIEADVIALIGHLRANGLIEG